MRRALLGLYSYFEFGLCVAAFLPILAVVDRLQRDEDGRRTSGRWMRRFARTAVRLTPLWKFSIEGEAPSAIRTQPHVVIANHASTADPFLLSFLPWDMRWVAKEELFRWPVLGRMMRFGGDIEVRRGNGESVRAMMDACRRTLRAGQSIMIFPEGTRSKDGRLRPFKDGAFKLAIEEQTPILPVAVLGTNACWPKGSRWFGAAKARARVLRPIETRGMCAQDVPRLRELARARIEAALTDEGRDNAHEVDVEESAPLFV